MSFQGDVAGIGLGELLQSLARGGKDGVLKLYGSDLAAHLGIEKGLLYLLESPEEDESELSSRCEAAWVIDPDPTLAAHRRNNIARADRMETVFSMLEAPNLHFRFEPGPLPLPRGMRARRSDPGVAGGDANPWGRGMGVEAILLEHARIADESTAAERPNGTAVPRRTDGGFEPPEHQSFLNNCDGQSTVQEIADRLGWPLRQAQGGILDLARGGLLRLATSQELLALAQIELEIGRARRAAARIQGWLRVAPPGPLYQADAELLTEAWESGQLGDAIERMPKSRARELIRKLDQLGGDLFEQLDRWEDLAEYHPSDGIARFKRAALRVAALSEGHEIEGGSSELIMECMRIARSFSDQGLESRARVTLLLAATAQPETPQTKTELGARLIEVGLTEEGSEWMLDAAQSLIDADDPDKGVQVLNVLLKGVPDNREAQALMGRTRSRLTRTRKRRKHGIVAAAGAVAVGLVAFVQYHGQMDRDRKFDEVTAAIANPTRALQLLDSYFPEDGSPKISALRGALEAQQRDQDRERRRVWEGEYDDTVALIEEGDPREALERIVELRQPPRLESGMRVEWGTVEGLLERLFQRLQGDQSRFAELPVEAEESVLVEESNWLVAVDEVLLAASEQERASFRGLSLRLEELLEGGRAVRTERAEALQEVLDSRVNARLDQLLAQARFEKGSGQFADAVATFAELLSIDPELEDLLTGEIEETEIWRAALDEARDLAAVGSHADALTRLEEAGLDPTDHPLKWRVDSDPTGATVTLGNGDQRVTPFVMETALGRAVELEFALAGCEPVTVRVEQPGDLLAPMHRSPERTWPSDYRVEAAPVPVGPDHLVADREGRVERIAADGEVRWSIKLRSLAGIARTPQFMPRRPGELLVLAEDGQVWIIDGNDGTFEGPIDLGSPVLEGPYPISAGIAATFENGTYAIWSDAIDPVVRPTQSRGSLGIERSTPYDEGNPNLVVLRAGRGLPGELTNPWSDWTIEVGETGYRVLPAHEGQKGFSVRRSGEWAFVAWEMPSSLVPAGRLWISDEEGLRSFLPTADPTPNQEPSQEPETVDDDAVPAPEETNGPEQRSDGDG